MSDIEMERFEAWFSTTPNFRMINDLLRNTFEKSESGNYVVSTVDDLWKAWQAAKQDAGEWVKTSERLPNLNEDSDHFFRLWCLHADGEVELLNARTPREAPESYPYWMAKSDQMPQPPKEQS